MQVFCDFWVIVPPTVDIEIMGDKLDVIAEDQTISSLSVSGTNKGSNAFTLNVGLVRVAVKGLLKIWGGEGRVMLEDISVGALDVNVLAGSVDLTTSQTPGSMSVTSESKSVCLVGDTMSHITASKLPQDKSNFKDVTMYTGNFSCAAGGCPLYSIASRGRGSVGVHVHGSQNPKIFAGEAFKNGWYASADHTPVVTGRATYAYVGFSGLGLMKGNVQLQWAANPIWWSFLADLTVCVQLHAYMYVCLRVCAWAFIHTCFFVLATCTHTHTHTCIYAC
jgi:hypothetical protein